MVQYGLLLPFLRAFKRLFHTVPQNADVCCILAYEGSVYSGADYCMVQILNFVLGTQVFCRKFQAHKLELQCTAQPGH